MIGTTFEHENRTYTVKEIVPKLPNVSKMLLAKKWDGNVYLCESLATGKKRKDFQGLFIYGTETKSFHSIC